jgi:transcriptional regulator with XRE-family HTH domain
MPYLPDIAEEIAEKRRALKFSQAELAQKAHISRATLDALENHRAHEIGFSKLSRLLAALGFELKLQDAAPSRPTLDDLIEEDRHDQGLDKRN